jgi:tetratricopeptide (TPR) repeat protein
MNFFQRQSLPKSLQFTDAVSFRLCTEGVRALEQYEREASSADLDRAVDRLGQCVQKYPNDLLPKFYLGSVKILQGYEGLNEAEGLLSEVIQRADENLVFPAKYNLAVAKVEKYDESSFQDAEKLLSELLASTTTPNRSQDKTLWSARATLFYIRAHRLWEKRQNADPSTIAAARTLTQELDNFASDLQKSSQSKNSTVLSDYWNAHGTVHELLALNVTDPQEKRKATEGAAQGFERAVDCKVDYVNSMSNLARFYQDVNGDLNKALQIWNQLLKIRPNGEYIHYNIGKILERMGDQPNALVHYQKAENAIPGAAEAAKRLKQQQAT